MAREASRIQRQNPVPPGRYWIDVPQEKFAVWDALVEANKGAIQIDHHETTFRSVDDDPLKGIDEWFIVYLTAPIAWPKGLAPPNTAPDWVQKRDDVYQRPEDPRKHPIRHTAEEIQTGLNDLGQWLQEQLVPIIVIAGIAYYLGSRRD